MRNDVTAEQLVARLAELLRAQGGEFDNPDAIATQDLLIVRRALNAVDDEDDELSRPA